MATQSVLKNCAVSTAGSVARGRSSISRRTARRWPSPFDTLVRSWRNLYRIAGEQARTPRGTRLQNEFAVNRQPKMSDFARSPPRHNLVRSRVLVGPSPRALGNAARTLGRRTCPNRRRQMRTKQTHEKARSTRADGLRLREDCSAQKGAPSSGRVEFPHDTQGVKSRISDSYNLLEWTLPWSRWFAGCIHPCVGARVFSWLRGRCSLRPAAGCP